MRVTTGPRSKHGLRPSCTAPASRNSFVSFLLFSSLSLSLSLSLSCQYTTVIQRRCGSSESSCARGALHWRTASFRPSSRKCRPFLASECSGYKFAEFIAGERTTRRKRRRKRRRRKIEETKRKENESRCLWQQMDQSAMYKFIIDCAGALFSFACWCKVSSNGEEKNRGGGGERKKKKKKKRKKEMSKTKGGVSNHNTHRYFLAAVVFPCISLLKVSTQPVLAWAKCPKATRNGNPRDREREREREGGGGGRRRERESFLKS